MILKTDEIIIPLNRIRSETIKADWEEFLGSFEQNGQLEPIVVKANGDGKWELCFGERRLTAIAELHAAGKTIPGLEAGTIRAIEDSVARTKLQALIAEFTENHHRADFNFVEKARFIRQIHELCTELYGKDIWTQELTARMLKLTPASITYYLQIEKAVATDPGGFVAKAETLTAALKRVKIAARQKERFEEAQKSENVFRAANEILAHADAREWIKHINSETIDIVIFDPPWGDDISHKAQENHPSFDDSAENAEALREALFPELFRVLKPNRFCVFWFGGQQPEQMREYALSFGFNLDFNRMPCIWFKPDKIVDQNRTPEKQLVDGYESFYLLRKGDPLFSDRSPRSNVFSYARVPLGSVIHPTEKPPELCLDLLKLCSVPGEILLDPCAGSSVFVDVAIKNNRKARACEFSEEYHRRGISRLSETLKEWIK